MIWEKKGSAMQNLHPGIDIKIYESTQKKSWDEFIEQSKNGHFFFKRDFLEYHADRFKDFSLMFYQHEKLIAIMPGNICDKILYTHQGLTYGGIISGQKMTTSIMLNIVESMLDFLRSFNIEKLVYKAIPHIYFKLPSEEAIFALYLQQAKILKRELSSVIDLAYPVNYTKGKKYNISKAKKYGLIVREELDYADFMELLTSILAERHNVKPTHSLQEIQLLAGRFPNNIKLFNCYQDNTLLAGVIIFENHGVAHTQYLANSEAGKSIGALDFTIDYLLKKVYNDRKYFSFGISTENNGSLVNYGLVDSKEGFGARAILHDVYELMI